MQEIVTETGPQQPTFEQQFAEKLEAVNAGVAEFANRMRKDAEPHGLYVTGATESYTSLLEAGGKRTRGVLALTGYELFGGSGDDPAIIKAAAIVEAEHAYVLVLDDVADASPERRGEPAAHIRMQHFVEQHTPLTDGRKVGEDVAIIAATDAHSTAQAELLRLDIDPQAKCIAGALLNEGLSLTAKGQILDVLSPIRVDMTMKEAEKIAVYKTAFYSFLLPLQVGGALAGATESQLEVFRDYALNAGLAFQMTDDILGLYGDQAKTGKPPKGDIIEGKMTMLYMAALGATSGSRYEILASALGNEGLTDMQFANCLRIIEASGAKTYIEEWAENCASQAIASLYSLPGNWPQPQIQFLQDMAMYGIRRNK